MDEPLDIDGLVDAALANLRDSLRAVMDERDRALLEKAQALSAVAEMGWTNNRYRQALEDVARGMMDPELRARRALDGDRYHLHRYSTTIYQLISYPQGGRDA